MLVKNLFTYWTGQAFSPSAAMRRKYEAFKSLLEHDARAHDLMAELEEMYHQQIRVDFSVIEKKYLLLSECVGGIVSDLKRMHPSRYLELSEFFEKIDRYAKHMFSQQAPPASPPFCLPLGDVPESETTLVGGKAFNLALLDRRFNLPTPSGFVITTNAFNQFIQYNRLENAIADMLSSVDIGSPHKLYHQSDQLMQMIHRSTIPHVVASQILDTFAAVFGPTDRNVQVAVRSSAVGEDGQASFAGQYKTVLNVGEKQLLEAYKTVLASKYSPEALAYRINYGLTDPETPMAVLVVEMIDTAASGVIYTQGLENPGADLLEIHATFGLGELLVQGEVVPDIFKVSKGSKPILIEVKIGDKQRHMILDQRGETRIEALAADRQKDQSIDEATALTLAGWGIRLEEKAGHPRDVEWCMDTAGELYLLQSRPLQIGKGAMATPVCRPDQIPNRALISGGDRVSSGLATGPVFVAGPESDLSQLPDNAVLVTPSASTHYVSIIEKVRAVIAQTGSIAGHFASVAREFGIPTLVNVASATKILKPGQIVTVFADGLTVYEGTVPARLAMPCIREKPISDRPFNRKLAYLMEFVSPLTLVDPDGPGFTPGGCRSLHDIIRFAHEEGTREMFSIGERTFGKSRGAKKLNSKIPMLIYLMDVGGGFADGAARNKTIGPEDVESVPFAAVWKGLNHPGIQWGTFTHFNWAEYDKIVMNGGIISAESAQLASYAVLSSEYLNLNLKFGYHFVILDTLCSDKTNENHILFRFNGGGGDEQGRSLRAAFLYQVLQRLQFDVTRKSDLVDARFSKGTPVVISEKLDLLGRLLGATRLMDMYMNAESQVEPYVDAFLNGRYHFSSVKMDE